MGQNKNNSLWLKITELMSKISTLLGKRIEKWTQKINNEIIKEENSGKGLTSATVVNMSESNMANQSEQNDSIKYNIENSSTPASVINKTKVSLGLGNFLFWGIIIYAFFSVPDKSEHVEAITKTVYETILSQKSELNLLEPTKIQGVIKAKIFESFEVENYYLFSICHKKSNYYDFPNDLLDGNFISFGILGKVFTRQEKIENFLVHENREREQRTLQNSSNTGYHGSNNDNTLNRDNGSEYDSYLEIVKNTQQIGDEIETYAHGCDYQVTHTVVVANHADYPVPGSAYRLIVSPESSSDNYYDYSRTNTREVQGKTIPANETATFSWTDVHFDGTWSYVDKVELKILEI